MQIIAAVDVMQQQASAWRAADATIAFVPTMGALHDGHAELIRQARARGRRLVVSIFVNPTQFGPAEDLAHYPRTIEADLERCRRAEVDAVFTPTADEIYPPGYQTFVNVAGMSQGLCGAHRDGHFCAVATVVLKLFHIVQPHVAFFGEKDYQQLQIIRRMVRDFLLPIDIASVPTVRAADGLALSSRNAYLSPTDRTQALAIPRALTAVQAHAAHTKDTAVLCDIVREQCHAAGLTAIDYIAVVDAESLAPLTTLDRPAQLCLAVTVGTTRLIDNVSL